MLSAISAPFKNSTSTDKTPTFDWNAVATANHYELWVSRIDVAQSQILHQDSLTTNSFTATTELPAGTFRVWVRAVAANGEKSVWSLPIDFKITATDPASTSPVEGVQLTGLRVSELDYGFGGVAEVAAPKVRILPPTEETRDADVSEVAKIIEYQSRPGSPEMMVSLASDPNLDQVMIEFAIFGA